MIQKQTMVKILVPVLYTVAILGLVIYQWSEQMIVWQGSSTPLYRNLMDYPAYIRHGFDLAEIQQMPEDFAFMQQLARANSSARVGSSDWYLFDAHQLRIINSPLPDLPQRSFLSPFGNPIGEFTIIIPIELDRLALASGIEPGIYLGYIGENWEIYFNGHLVQSEMHLNDTGQILSRRNWRGVHFSMDGNLLLEGTNILAFRIIGDPSYGVTGLYYSSPYYIDEYSIIRGRHLNILEMALCGIFGYTGIYYFFIFLSVRKKQELYNLFYSIASVFLCIYTLMFSGIVNFIIPNSDISIRLEYISLFMLVPMLGIFIEHFGQQKITKISWGFLCFYGVLSLTQVFFSTQYGDDVLMIWSATVLIYFTYIFFYNLLFYIRRGRKEENKDSSFSNIIIGLIVVYFCGIYDILDVLFFYNSSSLFLYSTFIFHIGMALTLSQRFRGMFSQLEQSNIILEEQVQERTLELKEQTAIAQQASQEALEASQAKSNFLAIMSHEIRTPLNAVIGFSEIELRNELPAQSKENIAHIHRSGSFLLGIINEILDISKIESGKLELNPDEYETAPLISGTVGLNRIRIGERPIQFVLEINADFPAKLIGDELRIRQILNNLLSNAIKYTHEGSVKLKIVSEELRGDNGELRDKKVKVFFIVSDTGIGIQHEDLEKLFDNYTQLDTQANRSSEGTGLGLAITKNLTEMMGGSISVESEYGKGSVFTAWIIQELANISASIEASASVESIAIEETSDSVESVVIGETVSEALRSFSYELERKHADISPLNIPNARVLVVDDIPENLLVARGLLKPYGLLVDTAWSGYEAIELVKNHDYNLIFMDHMMPEMDGVDTLAAIRDIEKENVSVSFAEGETQRYLRKQIPVIVLSAHTLRGMKEFYLEKGFNDFLSKPVNPQELDEVLRRFIVSEEFNTPQNIDAINNVNFAVEVESQRLDKLNHFCFAFESGRDIDSDYFKLFTAFIESLLTTHEWSGNPLITTSAKALADAGNKEDADAIRLTLPGFYKAMKEQVAAEDEQTLLQNGTDHKNIQDILHRIKKAIEDNQTSLAGKIVKELGAMSLTAQEREWYFILYDLLMEDKTEKALELIENILSKSTAETG